MAFRLYKASGSRVPDIVSHIPVGGTLAASPALIVPGTVVQITAGEIEVGATSVAVAGIMTSSYSAGGTANTYYSRGATASGQFPNGVVDTVTPIPFLPVTGTVPIAADVVADTVLVASGLPGATLDISTGGLTLTTSLNADFRIVKVLELNAAETHIAKVAGFFVTPGYFTA